MHYLFNVYIKIIIFGLQICLFIFFFFGLSVFEAGFPRKNKFWSALWDSDSRSKRLSKTGPALKMFTASCETKSNSSNYCAGKYYRLVVDHSLGAADRARGADVPLHVSSPTPLLPSTHPASPERRSRAEDLLGAIWLTSCHPYPGREELCRANTCRAPPPWHTWAEGELHWEEEEEVMEEVEKEEEGEKEVG